jgi:regulator of protease activity HflC (stomatin/prohibitin superfamily)
MRRALVHLVLGTGCALLVISAILIAGTLSPNSWRISFLARTLQFTGAAGVALGTLGLALTAEFACLTMVAARQHSPDATGRSRFVRLSKFLALSSPGDNARRVQGVVVPLLAGAAAAAALVLRPRMSAPAPDDAALLAAVLLAIAFPMLVVERSAAALRTTALPEAGDLRALLLLPVLGLPLAAAVVAAVGVGLDWASKVSDAACWLVAGIGAELVLRALARWFLPAPANAVARAAVASLPAAMLAGSFGREGVGAPLRVQFGLDFGRSWALGYLRAAAVPALVLSVFFCWMLTGLVAVGIDHRGLYERFGTAVAVLRPGLSLVLPWPLGRVRMVEFGTVHQLAIAGADQSAGTDTTTAEAAAPAAFDRLWDRPHPGEATYLVASESQGFPVVAADIRVLWRIGLDDASARGVFYGTRDPATLIRESANRRLAQFFASRTLAEILGARRETMAQTLRVALSADLARVAGGIDILDVVIEAVHPPTGAAGAYHAVQAAAIEARTSVAAEQGRAHGITNHALQEAHRLQTVAEAGAAETLQAARASAVRFDGDRRAYAQAGHAFLLERYLGDLSETLANTPLTIIDNRLDAGSQPVIDLRPLAAPAPPIPEDRD